MKIDDNVVKKAYRKTNSRQKSDLIKLCDHIAGV